MTRHVLTIVLSLVVVALGAIVGGRRLALAERNRNNAYESYQQTLKDANEVLALRSRRQVVNAAERPPQDVIAQVNGVLAATGIPGNRLKSLTPETDAALTNQPESSNSSALQYRKQSLRLTLEGLTVQEIGTFLRQWKTSQQVWTCSRIELTHARDRADANRYDINILLSAIYVATTSPPPS